MCTRACVRACVCARACVRVHVNMQQITAFSSRRHEPCHSHFSYDLMQTCWLNDPEKRPTFDGTCKALDDILTEDANVKSPDYVNHYMTMVDVVADRPLSESYLRMSTPVSDDEAAAEPDETMPLTENRVDETGPLTDNQVDETAPLNDNQVDETVPLNDNQVDETVPLNDNQVDETAPLNDNRVDETAPLTDNQVDETAPLTDNQVAEDV